MQKQARVVFLIGCVDKTQPQGPVPWRYTQRPRESWELPLEPTTVLTRAKVCGSTTPAASCCCSLLTKAGAWADQYQGPNAKIWYSAAKCISNSIASVGNSFIQGCPSTLGNCFAKSSHQDNASYQQANIVDHNSQHIYKYCYIWQPFRAIS